MKKYQYQFITIEDQPELFIDAMLILELFPLIGRQQNSSKESADWLLIKKGIPICCICNDQNCSCKSKKLDDYQNNLIIGQYFSNENNTLKDLVKMKFFAPGTVFAIKAKSKIAIACYEVTKKYTFHRHNNNQFDFLSFDEKLILINWARKSNNYRKKYPNLEDEYERITDIQIKNKIQEMIINPSKGIIKKEV